jgi:hypothetical protein
VPLLLGYTSKTGGPGGSCTHISSLKRRKLYLVELPTRRGAPGETRTRFFGLKVRYPTGRTYTPQFSTDLVSGVWLPLTTYTGPIAINDNQISITDTNPIPPQEFYRIQISLP